MSKVNDIVEVRRKGFEERFPLPDGCYLDDDGLYAGPCMPSFVNARFEAWCAALDSVCVELPEEKVVRGYSEKIADAMGFNDALEYCREAIERAGLRVKP